MSSDNQVDFLANELADLKENGPRQLYGVYTGLVLPFPDVPPVGMFEGRIKVRLTAIDPLGPLDAWARVATPMAGLANGMYFIPMPGTEVLVAFENGDIGSPFIIGSLWNGVARPPLPIPEIQIRAIRTLAGNQIVFTEVPPSVTIQSGPTPPIPVPFPPTPAPGGPSTVNLSPAGAMVMSPASIGLVCGTSGIAITPAGIVIQAAGNMIALTAAGILIQGLPGKVPSVLINPAG